MGIDRPSGTDVPVEDADKPPPQERPPGPPSDRPGQPGFPSRSESRAAAREAQEARAAERERERTTAPENGTGPPEARDEETAESSPAEQQNDQEETEAADETRETGTGLGERDAARPESETVEELRPDESEARSGPAETGELPPDADAEPSDGVQDEEDEPLSGEDAAEEPVAEEPPGTPDAEPEAGQPGRLDEPGENHRAQDTGNQDAGETPPQPPDGRGQPESRDHTQPRQDGHASAIGGPGPETPGGQILQAGSRPGLQEQGFQDVPGLVPAGQPEGTSEVQPPAEGDMQRTADGQFTPAESSEQSGTPGNGMTWPMEAEEGVTRWASPVVQVGGRDPGTRVENRDRNAEGRPETPATTDDETNKYRRLSDRTPAGTPDRGDPISPEDDPADRNPDPEDGRRGRWENYDRVNTAFEATHKVLKGVKDLQAKPPPTGHAEVRTDTTMHAPDTHVGNPADTVGNAIIVTLTVAGWAMQTYRKFMSSRRREHADN